MSADFVEDVGAVIASATWKQIPEILLGDVIVVVVRHSDI
jgi:hypothetical protein